MPMTSLGGGYYTDNQGYTYISQGGNTYRAVGGPGGMQPGYAPPPSGGGAGVVAAGAAAVAQAVTDPFAAFGGLAQYMRDQSRRLSVRLQTGVDPYGGNETAEVIAADMAKHAGSMYYGQSVQSIIAAHQAPKVNPAPAAQASPAVAGANGVLYTPPTPGQVVQAAGQTAGAVASAAGAGSWAGLAILFGLGLVAMRIFGR